MNPADLYNCVLRDFSDNKISLAASIPTVFSTHKLHLITINVSGMNTMKLDTIVDFMNEFKVNICCLQETHMTRKDVGIIRDHLNRKNKSYKLMCATTTSRSCASGVAFIIHSSMKALRIPINVCDPYLADRILQMDIISGSQSLRVINVYFPAGNDDNTNRLALQNLVESSIRNCSKAKCPYIIAGDFNACTSILGRNSKNWYCKDRIHLNWVNKLNLTEIIDSCLFSNVKTYTRVRNEQMSIIDNFYACSSISSSSIKCYISNWMINDHRICGWILSPFNDKTPHTTSINKSNRDVFIDYLLDAVDQYPKEFHGYDSILQVWRDAMDKLPSEQSWFKSKRWNVLNSVVLKLRNLSTRMETIPGQSLLPILQRINFEHLVNVNKQYSSLEIKSWINICSRMRRKEIASMQKVYCEQRTEFANKLLANAIKETVQANCSPSVSGVILKINNSETVCKNPNIVNDTLYNHYEERFRAKGDLIIPSEIRSVLDKQFSKDLSETTLWRNIDIQSIVSIINSSPINSCGWDHIDIGSLKAIVQRSSYNGKFSLNDPKADKFLQWMRQCIEDIINGHIDSRLKDGIVTPVFKLKEVNNELDLYRIENYRPINVLPIFMRISSKFVAFHMQQFIKQHCIISKNQAGFIKGKSTIQMHALIRSELENAKSKQLPFSAIFLDLKDAYTSCDWSILLQILHLMKLPMQFVRYVRALYQSAKIAIKSAYGITKYFSISRGVLMGEPIAPILFDLYIEGWIRFMNDRQKARVKVNTRAYADDIIISSLSYKAAITWTNIGAPLLNKLGLEISFKKSEAIILNKKGKKVNTKCRIANNIIKHIGRKGFIKYLGIPLNFNSTSDMSKLLIQKIKGRLKSMHTKFLLPNMMKQILVCLLFSMTTYACHLKMMNSFWIQKVESCIFGFFKRKALINTCMKREPLKLSSDYHGYNLFSLELFQDRLFVKSMFKLCNVNEYSDSIIENIKINLENIDPFSLGGKFIETVGRNKFSIGKNNFKKLIHALKSLKCSSIIEKKICIWISTFTEESLNKTWSSEYTISKNLNKEYHRYNKQDMIYGDSVQFDTNDTYKNELYTILLALLKIPFYSEVCILSMSPLIVNAIRNIRYLEWCHNHVDWLDYLLALHLVVVHKNLKVISRKLNKEFKSWRLDTVDSNSNSYDSQLAHKVLQWSKFVYPSESDIYKEVNMKWNKKWTNDLVSIDSSPWETENILQVNRMSGNLIDLQYSFYWLKSKLCSQIDKLVLFKRFYFGDYIYHFKKVKKCNECQCEVTPFHYYLECRKKRLWLSSLANSINGILPPDMRVRFDWNLAILDVDRATQFDTSLFTIDPRGYIALKSIENLKIRLNKDQVDDMIDRIFSLLASRVRLCEYKLNHVFKYSYQSSL